MKNWLYIPILFCTLITVGCHRQPPVVSAIDNNPDLSQNLANANRFIVESEETQIKSYVERRQWNVTQTPSGVRIHEYQRGEGAKIDWEEKITVQYNISDLSGNAIYGLMNDTLTVGHRQPTAGFDAAMLQLHHGSKAHIVVPSNEAYGMIGDGDLITNRKVIVYDVTVD